MAVSALVVGDVYKLLGSAALFLAPRAVYHLEAVGTSGSGTLVMQRSNAVDTRTLARLA